MAALGNAAPYATGDPTICSGCRACLSAVSVLTPVPNKPIADAAAAAGSQPAVAGNGSASLKLSPSPRPPSATGGESAAGAGAEEAKANAGPTADAGATADAIADAKADATSDATADAFVEGAYDWTCEYCGEVNRLELDDMEKPIKGQDSVDYILEMAPIANAIAQGKGGGEDKVYLKFYIYRWRHC